MKHLSRRRMLRLTLSAGAASLVSPVLPNPWPAILTRPIPSTGERLPLAGMGTWRTFDVGSDPGARAVRREVLETFYALGGRLVDSSPMYGSSEQVVGELAAATGHADDLFLATKVWTTGREAGIRQMESSLRKMGTRQMDLMQVHNLVDFSTHIRTLRQWKEEGRIRYLGITHYLTSAYGEVERLLRNEPLDFLQINYNLQVRDAADRLLPLAADKGLAVIINRPFREGALFDTIRNKTLPPWAADYGIQNWAQFFLKFIISHPAVTCAIPATTQPAHMQENMGAAYGRLPDEKTRRQMVEWWEK